MTEIILDNQQNTILNAAGRQLLGSRAAGQEGLNPKELLEASLGLCVSLVLEALLRRDGKMDDGDGLRITVDSHKDPGGENRIARFDIGVALPEGLDAAYVQKALTMAERGCTMGNTVRHGAEITLSALPSEEEPS